VARTIAAVLIVIWLALFIREARSLGFNPSNDIYRQAVCLAVVFAGYAIGVRNELVGGVAAIIGTLAFFAVVLTAIGEVPGLAAALFAVPGVLYLLDWHYDKRRCLKL
jgi:hypothetical protein